MKKLTTFVKSCSKLMLLTMTVVLSAFAAKAADPVDLGELTFNKLYTIPARTYVTATFTAPADGKLTMDGGNSLGWYTDPAHTKLVSGTFSGKYQNINPECKGQVYYYNVTKGTTYYLATDEKWGAFSQEAFMLYMDGFGEEPFKLMGVEPTPNSPFLLNLYNDASFSFNKDLTWTYSRALIIKKNADDSYTAFTNKTLSATRSGKNYIVKSIKSKLTELINSGDLVTGDTFYIGFPQPKCNEQTLEFEKGLDHVYATVAGQEMILFPYVVPSIPTKVVSQHIPDTFLSYWAKGDENAVFSITFDNEVTLKPRDPNVKNSGSYIALGYGNLESENPEYYYEENTLSLSEDKKTVSFDFSGKRRTGADMLPLASTQIYETMGVKFAGIYDKFGNPVETGVQGTFGSFSYAIPYKEVSKVNFSADFTPANGSDLTGVNEIEVYFASLTGVTFDGFKLSYTQDDEEKSVIVKLDECKFEKEGEGGAYTFAIPESIKALGEVGVTVTLNNLVTNDGYDHSQEVSATYNTFVITYSNPGMGWASKSIADEYKFEFQTNWTKEQYPGLYMEYQIVDMNPDEPDEAIVKSAYELAYDEANQMWTATNPRELVLYQGHTYHIEVNAWKDVWDMRGGKAPYKSYVVIEGQTQPYVNSNNVLNSITPDPEAADFKPLTADDNVITLEFDGPVYLEKASTFINEGFGMTHDFESITPVEGEELETADGNKYMCSNIWKLTIAKDYLAAQTAPVTVSFVAKDVENKILQGNNGKREQSFFSYAYEVAAQWADYEIALEPAEAEPTSVVSFRVSSEAGISYNQDETAHGKAIVYTKTQGTAATVTEIINPNDGNDDYSVKTTYLILKLDQPITEAGEYRLVIPENFFVIGEELEARNSMEKGFTFDVYENGGGETTDLNVTADPADKSTVKQLSGNILLTFKDYSEVAAGSGRATITHNGVTENLPDAEFGVAWNEMNQPLGKTYTEAGTYTISFPAGYFGLGAAGDPCPAFTLTYTIDDGTGVAIVAVDGKYRVYNLTGVLVLDTENAADLDNLAAGIYVINGQKVVIRK